MYGNACEKRCPNNCKDNVCHIQIGTCFGCTPGWKGTTCNTSMIEIRGGILYVSMNKFPLISFVMFRALYTVYIAFNESQIQGMHFHWYNILAILWSFSERNYVLWGINCLEGNIYTIFVSWRIMFSDLFLKYRRTHILGKF